MAARIEPDHSADPRSHAAAPVRRRTVLAGAAWAVPAVALTSTSPAFAASSTLRVTVSTPDNRIAAAGATSITAAVTDAAGAPQAGKPVVFQGPSGSTLSSTTAVTNSSGTASVTLDLADRWATPGSSVVVGAVCEGAADSTGLTVLGSNLVVTSASSYAFQQSELVFPSPVVRATVVGFTVSARYVLLQNGEIWCRGLNSSGQLGDGTTTTRASWGPVPGLTGVIDMAAGDNHVVAVRSDGTVWTWGANDSGQLGDGTKAARTSPGRASTVPGSIVRVAARSSVSFAIGSGGSVWAWGYNGAGGLGDGTTTNSSSAVPVVSTTAGSSAPLTNVTTMACGDGWAIARRSDGTVVTWGRNTYGQLGNNSTTDSSRPQLVPTLSNVSTVSAGPYTAYALQASGALKSWGENSSGAIGDGTTTNRTAPVSVSGLGSGVADVAGYGYEGAFRASVEAMLTDGTVRVWGHNDRGQLGDGTTNNRSTPVTPILPTGSPGVAKLSEGKTVSGMLVLKTR